MHKITFLFWRPREIESMEKVILWQSASVLEMLIYWYKDTVLLSRVEPADLIPRLVLFITSMELGPKSCWAAVVLKKFQKNNLLWLCKRVVSYFMLRILYNVLLLWAGKIALQLVQWIGYSKIEVLVIKPCLTWERKSLASKVLPKEQNTEEQSTLPHKKV